MGALFMMTEMSYNVWNYACAGVYKSHAHIVYAFFCFCAYPSLSSESTYSFMKLPQTG